MRFKKNNFLSKSWVNRFFSEKKGSESLEQTILHRLLPVVQFCNKNNSSKIYKRITSHQKYETIFPTHKTDVNFGKCVIAKNISGEMHWLRELFLDNKENINLFLHKINDYEKEFAKGNYSNCVELLSEMQAIHGLTLWGVIESIRCSYNHFEFSVAQDNTARLKSKTKGLANFLIDYIVVKVQTKSVETVVTAMRNILTESRNIHFEVVAEYISMNVLPYELDPERNPAYCPLYVPTLSVFDQYLLFRNVTMDIILSGKLELIQDYYNIYSELSEKIDDKTLRSIAASIVGTKYCCYEDDLSDILSQYSNGEYTECRENVLQLLSESPNRTAYLELLAKCIIRTDSDAHFFENNYLNSMLNLLCKIIKIDKNCSEYISELHALLMNCYPQRWCLPIYSIAYGIFKDVYFDEVLIANQRLSLSALPTTPMLYFGECSNSYYLSISETRRIASEPHRFETEREYKAQLYELLETATPNDSKFKEVLKSIDVNKYCFPYEFFRLEIEYYIKRDCFKEALIKVVDYCMLNIEHFRCFKILELLEKINEIVLEECKGMVELTILYDIYSKKVSRDKDDLRNEAYEDYVNSFGEFRPSTLFSGKDSLSLKEIYFLKNICIPSVMDISYQFEKSEELKSERIKVIDLLLAKCRQDKIELLEEKNKLISDIVVDKSKVGIETCKIYVDIDLIKENELDVYRSLFEIYKSKFISDANDVPASDSYVQVGGDDIGYVLPRDDKRSFLLRFLRKMHEDYVDSSRYGLSKYLCTEIRHGVFFNYMRAGVEQFNIITDTLEDQSYGDSEYWSKFYNYYDSASLETVNHALKHFSRCYDETIKATNDWFRINGISPSEGGGYFEITSDDLELIQAMIDAIEDFNIFFDFLLQFYWNKTEIFLQELQRRLNEDFRKSITVCYDELVRNLKEEIGEQENLAQLFTKIYESKNDMFKRIGIVSEWIQRREKIYHGNRELLTLIEVAKQSYIAIKGDSSIIFNDIFDRELLSELKINTDRESRAIVIALVTAFDNAVKHGESTERPEITLDVKRVDALAHLVVKNKFKREMQKIDIDKVFEQIDSLLNSPKKNILMTSVGGTGLYKIKELLSQVNNKFTARFKHEDYNYFVADILMEVA